MTSLAERILIVEDDPTLRRVLRDNLIFKGYRVDAVSDGSWAISYVRASTRPIWCVLDLTLPDFDGLDLCPGAAAIGQGAHHHPVRARPED